MNLIEERLYRICAVCEEEATGDCYGLLTGRPKANGYRHRPIHGPRIRIVTESEWLKLAERRRDFRFRDRVLAVIEAQA